MRLISGILVSLAVLCVLLPFYRDMLPFRVALRSADASTIALTLGLAGLAAFGASRV